MKKTEETWLHRYVGWRNEESQLEAESWPKK